MSVEKTIQLISECRDALSAALPYMEGSTFSSVYARDQVRRQILLCEIAISDIEVEKP
jgi:hypothetical protein